MSETGSAGSPLGSNPLIFRRAGPVPGGLPGGMPLADATRMGAATILPDCHGAVGHAPRV